MEKSSVHKPKVLIVEDNINTQLLYKKVFLADWFEVYFADNGQHGIEQYEEIRPDLIILDLMLPLMTGYQVLKEIRKTRNDTDTTIIVSTALSEKEDVVECSKMGIQGYVIKPFNFKELRQKMAEYSPLADLSKLDDE